MSTSVQRLPWSILCCFDKIPQAWKFIKQTFDSQFSSRSPKLLQLHWVKVWQCSLIQVSKPYKNKIKFDSRWYLFGDCKNSISKCCFTNTSCQWWSLNSTFPFQAVLLKLILPHTILKVLIHILENHSLKTILKSTEPNTVLSFSWSLGHNKKNRGKT